MSKLTDVMRNWGSMFIHNDTRGQLPAPRIAVRAEYGEPPAAQNERSVVGVNPWAGDDFANVAAVRPIASMLPAAEAVGSGACVGSMTMHDVLYSRNTYESDPNEWKDIPGMYMLIDGGGGRSKATGTLTCSVSGNLIPEQCTISVRMVVDYLPFGQVDQTEVTFGTDGKGTTITIAEQPLVMAPGLRHIIKMQWRDNGTKTLFASAGSMDIIDDGGFGGMILPISESDVTGLVEDLAAATSGTEIIAAVVAALEDTKRIEPLSDGDDSDTAEIMWDDNPVDLLVDDTLESLLSGTTPTPGGVTIGEVNAAIATHDTSPASHDDIRELVSAEAVARSAQVVSGDNAIRADMHNVPPGGAIDQVLAKASTDDYDLVWADGGTGGGLDSAAAPLLLTGADLTLTIGTGLVVDGSDALVPDFGTGAGEVAEGDHAHTAPAWGDVTGKPTTFAPIIGSGAADAVAGNDARLTNTRDPNAHTHAEADVTNLTTDLAGKAAVAHTHTSPIHTWDWNIPMASPGSYSDENGDETAGDSGPVNGKLSKWSDLGNESPSKIALSYEGGALVARSSGNGSAASSILARYTSVPSGDLDAVVQAWAASDKNVSQMAAAGVCLFAGSGASPTTSSPCVVLRYQRSSHYIVLENYANGIANSATSIASISLGATFGFKVRLRLRLVGSTLYAYWAEHDAPIDDLIGSTNSVALPSGSNHWIGQFFKNYTSNTVGNVSGIDFIRVATGTGAFVTPEKSW